MASYGNTVLTSAGIDLVKRVIAKTATFEITRVATSSDSRLTNASISAIEAMTALPSVNQTGTVTAFDTSNNKQIGLKCEFTNQGLTNQYSICGVGIYAKEAGKNEILFAVAPAKEPETMPAKPDDQSVLFSFGLNMYVVVGQSSAMTITATTEGVVKSINSTIKPDANGDVSLPFQSQAEANQLRDDLTRLLDSETQNRQNDDNYVLSQAKAYTDDAKRDLTEAMNEDHTSILNQLIASINFASRQAWTPTVITTAIDLNDIKDCGSYFIQNMPDATSNTPIPNSWLFVRVEGVPTRITQTVWEDIDPTIQWVRVYTGTWGNWTQITKAI